MTAETALAAVWASPGDDAARLAWAETLDDARAAIVRLQAADRLDAAGRKQLKAALKQHRATLAGPLAGVLKAAMTFRLGFLSGCALRGDIDLPAAILASPWWSTVEVLDLNCNTQLPVAADLPSLRALSGAILRGDISDWRPLPTLTRLSLIPGGGVAALAARTRAILDATDRLPALTELELLIPTLPPVEPPPMVMEGALAGQLQRLTVSGSARSTQTLLPPGGGVRAVHDRSRVKALIAQLPALERWPTLVSVGANIVYGGGAPVRFGVTRGDGGALEVGVVASGQLHGWWRVLADNLGFLAESLSAGDTLSIKARVDDPAAWLATAAAAAAASGVTLDASGVRQR